MITRWKVCRQSSKEQLELRLQAEGELTGARQLVAEVDHQLREAEQQRAAIEHRAEAVRAELEGQRIANQSLQVQRETFTSIARKASTR